MTLSRSYAYGSLCPLPLGTSAFTPKGTLADRYPSAP